MATPEEVIAEICARYDGSDNEAARLTEAALRRIAWRKARKATTKVCSRCKEEKPLEAFGKDVSRRDGMAVYCRACRASEHL